METRAVVIEPDLARDYDDRATQAAFSVLIELGQVLGAYRDAFVIVGGGVPDLLLPKGSPPHIGTRDIDLMLNPAKLGQGTYAELIDLLERRGYERGVDDLKPFQLRRVVEIDDGAPVAVLVDLLMPEDSPTERRRQPLVDGLRVQEATGGTVALAHNEQRTFDGLMPDGRQNQVRLLVATIPALLVMKGYALDGRDKKKDAYDIYYSVRNYEGGIDALANECRELMTDGTARTGVEHIASKFRRVDDFGPSTVRMFLQGHSALGDMTPEQVQTDAFGQVNALLRAMGLRS